jgi:hypothetical protein
VGHAPTLTAASPRVDRCAHSPIRFHLGPADGPPPQEREREREREREKQRPTYMHSHTHVHLFNTHTHTRKEGGRGVPGAVASHPSCMSPNTAAVCVCVCVGGGGGQRARGMCATLSMARRTRAIARASPSPLKPTWRARCRSTRSPTGASLLPHPPTPHHCERDQRHCVVILWPTACLQTGRGRERNSRRTAPLTRILSWDDCGLVGFVRRP